MKIFDVWNYNGEPIADARIDYLQDHVDVFVVVEGRHTFTGQRKDQFFFERAAFKDHPKVIFLPVEEYIPGDPWANEKLQRDAPVLLLQTMLSQDDLVFASDVDEIPDMAKLPSVLAAVARGGGAALLLQDFFYYNFNLKMPTVWPNALALNRAVLSEYTIEELRGKLSNGVRCGWHCSNAMSAEEIARKIRSFSHTETATEENLNTENIRRWIAAGVNLFAKDKPLLHCPSDQLPPALRKFNRAVRESQGLVADLEWESVPLDDVVKVQTVDTMSHEADVAQWAEANRDSARILARLVKDKSKAILDAACGDGLVLGELAKLGYSDLTGVDVADAKLERAAVLAPSAKILKEDLHALSFADETFDIIHSRHTLEHCYDPAQVACEFRRVLRRGGFLYMVIPLPDKPCLSHVGTDMLGTNGCDKPDPVIGLIKLCRFNCVAFDHVMGAHGMEGRFLFEAL